jgi:Flp pilus assembly protein TadD
VGQDPALWRAWLGLGRIYDHDEQWSKADNAYARALQLAPDEPTAYNNYGLSLMARGELSKASSMFKKAMRLDAGLSPVPTNRRLALALDGRYEEALSGVDHRVRPIALNDVGYAAIMREDYPAARVFLLQAIEESPSYLEAAHANLRYLDALEQRERIQAVGGGSS